MWASLPSHMENQQLPIFLIHPYLYTSLELTLLDAHTNYMAVRKVAMSHLDCPSANANPWEIHPYFAPAVRMDRQSIDH